MATIAGIYEQNVHQIGLTVAWTFMLNVGIVAGALRYDRIAALFHALFMALVLVITFVFILYYLIPYGFNAGELDSWLLYAHGIVGVMLLGFVVLQVIGGTMSRLLTQGKQNDIFKIKILRNIHRFSGYFLALFYKFVLLWAWVFNSINVVITLCIWQGIWIAVYIYIKLKMTKLEQKIIDNQTINYVCPEVESMMDVKKVTENYIMFANYVYDARGLEKNHPGGFRVIELVKGREVDRFIYGMYSAELYSQLAAYSHSMYSLQLVGNPIAKYVPPLTYQMDFQVTQGIVKYMNCISQKTQIYALGLVLKDRPLKYLGYSDIRQLGQYYSFTINGQITRLYTAVNFLTPSNVERMNEILKAKRESLPKIRGVEKSRAVVETEMPAMTTQNNGVTEKLLDMNEQSSDVHYLPLMLKVYKDGKLTAALKAAQFYNLRVQFSMPRGRGLELDTTSGGRIIVVAGGTGLFPFSDTIDLLYKAMIIREGHKMSQELLRADPVLRQRPFDKFTFVFLIAVAEPEDIHPTTYNQLVGLSEDQSRIKIALRVSKNGGKLKTNCGKLEFTREYFTKRVIAEASVKGFSRVWICGPPKLNCDTAKILVENGFNNDNFLLV